MNICTPGNCICDAREWAGDTDCFGNTEEDDRRMYGGMAIDLLREWDGHKGSHRCFYEESDDAGMALCPRSYPTLGAWLEANEFPVEAQIGPFFGRDLNEPNFRSRSTQTEFPVGISGQEKPVSIAELRRRGQMKANKGIHYRQRTDETLRQRSSRARNEALENEQQPWEVEAMEYYKERLDEIHESMVRAFAGVMAEQGRLHTRIDALVELVSKEIDERSESRVAVEPKVTVTLENVPADISQVLQEELQTRVERLMARREHEARR